MARGDTNQEEETYHVKDQWNNNRAPLDFDPTCKQGFGGKEVGKKKRREVLLENISQFQVNKMDQMIES